MLGLLRFCGRASLVCTIFVVSSAVQAAITTPYFNDFSVDEPFTESGAAWSLSTAAGTYTNTFSTNGTSSSATTAVTGLGGPPATATGFIMSSKFTITANAGTGTNNTVGFAALGAAANPSSNFLLADIGTNGSTPIIRLLRFNDTGGNDEISRASFSGALTTGTEYTMTLTGTYTAASELSLLFQLFNGSTLVTSTSGTVSSALVEANLTGSNFGLRNRTNAGSSFTVAFNDFSINSVAAIPEPTTWAAGAVSLAGLLLWRRRKAS